MSQGPGRTGFQAQTLLVLPPHMGLSWPWTAWVGRLEAREGASGPPTCVSHGPEVGYLHQPREMTGESTPSSSFEAWVGRALHRPEITPVSSLGVAGNSSENKTRSGVLPRWPELGLAAGWGHTYAAPLLGQAPWAFLGRERDVLTVDAGLPSARAPLRTTATHFRRCACSVLTMVPGDPILGTSPRSRPTDPYPWEKPAKQVSKYTHGLAQAETSGAAEKTGARHAGVRVWEARARGLTQGRGTP